MTDLYTAFMQNLLDKVNTAVAAAYPRPPFPKEPPVPDTPPTPRPAPTWAAYRRFADDASGEWWEEYDHQRRKAGQDNSNAVTVLLNAVPTMAYWEGRAHDAEQALAELRKQHDDPITNPLGTVRTSPDEGDISLRIVVVRSPFTAGPDVLTWITVSGPAGAMDGYTNDEVRGWPITGVVPGSEADQQAQQ